jgi:cell pole-organizing protein PopZ
MPETTEAEPSMDEILASIRRIIADDGGAGATTAPSEDEPLLLTERVDPLSTEPQTTETESTEDETPMTAEEPHTETAPDSEWIGEAAAVQASTAFDKLAAINPAPPPGETIAMPPPGRNLEDITRDLLRPMLKDWLDENLPRIVQDRVDEEVERLARRRVR